MISYLFEHLTAGLWNYVWHWGTAMFIIIACIAVYVLADYVSAVPVVRIFAAPLQKYKIDLLWVAAAAALYLVGLATGDADATNRCKVQQVVVQKEITVIVNDAEAAKAAAEKQGIKMEDSFDDPNN
jgi:hypothetical protein